jgi:carbon monoxide dehydrogenase subunit G
VKIEHEITIDRPVSEVFAYLTDVDNLQSWQDSVLEIRRDDDAPVAVGSRWTEVREVMNRKMEQPIEVTELETDRTFTVQSLSGPVRMRVEHRLEPAGEGTRVRVVGEAELGGFAKLGGPMVKRQARQMFEADFAKLKQQLESG